MTEFLGGESFVEVILYTGDCDQARRDTATTARMAAQTEYWTEGPSTCRHLLGSSSEHFAAFCRTGQAHGFAAGRAVAKAARSVFWGMADSASQSAAYSY